MEQRCVTVACTVRLWAPDRECRKLICPHCVVKQQLMLKYRNPAYHTLDKLVLSHTIRNIISVQLCISKNVFQPFSVSFLPSYLVSLNAVSDCFCSLDLFVDCGVETLGLKEQNDLQYELYDYEVHFVFITIHSFTVEWDWGGLTLGLSTSRYGQFHWHIQGILPFLCHKPLIAATSRWLCVTAKTKGGGRHWQVCAAIHKGRADNNTEGRGGTVSFMCCQTDFW